MISTNDLIKLLKDGAIDEIEYVFFRVMRRIAFFTVQKRVGSRPGVKNCDKDSL